MQYRHHVGNVISDLSSIQYWSCGKSKSQWVRTCGKYLHNIHTELKVLLQNIIIIIFLTCLSSFCPLFSYLASYHIILYCIILYHIISYHIISYHILLYHIILYHIISYYIISYHIKLYHTLSHYIISYHIISYHTISYHIKSSYIISY